MFSIVFVFVSGSVAGEFPGHFLVASAGGASRPQGSKVIIANAAPVREPGQPFTPPRGSRSHKGSLPSPWLSAYCLRDTQLQDKHWCSRVHGSPTINVAFRHTSVHSECLLGGIPPRKSAEQVSCFVDVGNLHVLLGQGRHLLRQMVGELWESFACPV